MTEPSLVKAPNLAEWQNGYAPDCKSVYLGSTPGSASIIFKLLILKIFFNLLFIIDT
jgi:hypothetical protein